MPVSGYYRGIKGIGRANQYQISIFLFKGADIILSPYIKMCSVISRGRFNFPIFQRVTKKKPSYIFKIEGDIRNLNDCNKACDGVDYVLHQAALGSVPRSIDNPIRTNQSNIDGFLNMLLAARDANVKRFVYAASSSTYGDHPALPKKEDIIGNPLSPYAVTKYVNEFYADVFARTYGMESIGLRYFNVFGRRQDPNGVYAAVIPRWIGEFLGNKAPTINGDGQTSRDFCYIDNVIQANLLSAITENTEAVNQVYNIASGGRTTLNELFYMIKELLGEYHSYIRNISPTYGPFRPGDVRHSQADIQKAKNLLSYQPIHDVKSGMTETVRWFCSRHITVN